MVARSTSSHSGPALGAGDPAPGIDLHAAHLAQVHDQRPVGNGMARDRVAAATDAIGSPAPRAAWTAATTSAVDRHWTIVAGRRSIVPLKVCRAAS